jgi:HSP20 family protein
MSINPDGSRKTKGYRSIQHRMTQQMETLPVTPEDDTPEPLVDTIIDGNSVKIVAEIPGMERDKIDINYSSDSVSIHAHDREVEYFKRIRLPVRVDPRSAKVSLKNGVLEISLRKANEKSIK